MIIRHLNIILFPLYCKFYPKLLIELRLKSRLPTLWTRSYYVETIGHISEKTIKKYMDDQKNK